ncbi:MAG: OmpA family protein [Bacteroidota bacterium]
MLTSGQNLIPNPGFENLFIPDEYQWVQPINRFYHWEQNSKGFGQSHEGDFFNGICMYNWHPCEYLHIKLSETLEKDSLYHLSAWIKLASFKAKGHQHLYKLGALFTENAINTRRRFVINSEPQAFFTISDTLDKVEWNKIETEFKAKGKEEFMTIGYFPALYFSKEEMKDYVAPRDSSLLMMAEKSKKSKRKKKNKYKEKDLAEFRKMINQKAKSESQMPKPVSSFGQFTIRYYFDDFCLARKEETGTYDCTNKSIELESALDQRFRLNRVYFESGEATLLDSSFYELDRLSFFLSYKPKVRIKITGHTDDVGKAKDNQVLSEKRAQAVHDYLISKGLSASRISFEGKGETEPRADNALPEGRFINRRVEFQIIDN